MFSEFLKALEFRQGGRPMTYKTIATVCFATMVAFLFQPCIASASDSVKGVYTGPKQCGDKYPGSFEAGLSNKCYRCPDGYKHNLLRGIKSDKVCYKKHPKAHAKAHYEGKEGCPKGSKEYLPTGKCYACPKGYKRNLNPGNPAKAKVCSVDKASLLKKYKAARKKGLSDINFLLALARKPGPAPTTGQLKARLSSPDTPPTGPFGVTQYSGDRKRIDYMERVLNDMPAYNAKHGTNYQTVSYVKTSGMAVGLGYAKEWGFSMTKKADGTKECRKLETKNYSAGIQVDFDVAEGVGIHQYPIGDLAGHSNGYASAVAWFDSVFSWTTSGQPAIGLYWPSLTKTDGAMVADGGVITSFGVSAAYTHAYTTQAQTPVPCDVLVWGPDFDKVTRYSWVAESK
ncbi:MAG TPA: hypothetical protein VKA31_09525 [Mariprofundaceae bacterium]|nr:hypothetical protein [Mariprofundaceae bacterium]